MEEPFQLRRYQNYVSVTALVISWEESDLDLSQQLEDLEILFKETFRYAVEHFRIPSEEPGARLRMFIEDFLRRCGSESSLVIIYYGGHGVQPESNSEECIWAAKILGGPTLSWSPIQRKLYSAKCDVVLFLDCCYAGQAFRATARHNFESLVAADSTSMVPVGRQGAYLSFTQVLIQELRRIQASEEEVRIPFLHSQMLQKKARLEVQPLYVEVTKGSAGNILLRRLENNSRQVQPPRCILCIISRAAQHITSSDPRLRTYSNNRMDRPRESTNHAFSSPSHISSSGPGFELIGIAARISQLVQYSAKLIEILQEICQNAAHSAKRYRRHERQVKQVIEIAEMIRKTAGLHSESIESHLLSLTETTQSIEEAIERTLFAGPAKKFQKCLRVLDVTKADSAILQRFDDLEHDKSCLTLCLLGNFRSLIIGYQPNVKQIPDLQRKLDDIQKSLQDCTEIAEESRRAKENTRVSSDHEFCSSCGSERRNMHGPVYQELVQIVSCAVQVDTLPAREIRDSEVCENGSCTSEQTLVAEDDTMALSNDNQLDMSSYSGEEMYDEISGEHGWYDGIRTYSEITACDQASQINGSFGFGPSDGPRGHSSWFNVRAADKSNHWSGDVKAANLLVGFFSLRGS